LLSFKIKHNVGGYTQKLNTGPEYSGSSRNPDIYRDRAERYPPKTTAAGLGRVAEIMG